MVSGQEMDQVLFNNIITACRAHNFHNRLTGTNTYVKTFFIQLKYFYRRPSDIRS